MNENDRQLLADFYQTDTGQTTDDTTTLVYHARTYSDGDVQDAARRCVAELAAQDAPLRDRPLMPHVAELAGEHRGERDDLTQGGWYPILTASEKQERSEAAQAGEADPLEAKTRQWLADEEAKTQAWLAEHRPSAGMHTHNAWDNRDITDEEWTHHLGTPEVREQVDAMLAGAEERARQPAQRDDLAEIQQRLDELRERCSNDRAAGDDIDREERAFWDSIDYSALGKADVDGDGA